MPGREFAESEERVGANSASARRFSRQPRVEVRESKHMRKSILIYTVALISFASVFAGSALAQQQTVDFRCLGYPQFFGVPAGVTQITAEVIGSDGNSLSSDPNRGGKGAKVTTIINVTPGTVLTILSGCKTGYGFTRGGKPNANYPLNPLISWKGVSGGGSSAILGPGNTVLAVAGGGGASGQDGYGGLILGGRGGDATILPNGNGSDGSGGNPGAGGIWGASSLGDGAQGQSNGNPFGGGGGGGGGWEPGNTGGGGGGGAVTSFSGSGGGGGGGKNYLNPAFTTPINQEVVPGDTAEHGSIRIIYNGPSQGHRFEGCSGTSVNYTVPSQVRSLLVTGVGGDGGGWSKTLRSLQMYSVNMTPYNILDVDSVAYSGTGAAYIARIPVVPGEQLSFGVGCHGSISTVSPGPPANRGGNGGYGIINGGTGGNGDRLPGLGNWGIGGSGGGGATGIARGAGNPILVVPGGGGGGGVGGAYDFGCYAGEGGVGAGRNGGNASPCANFGAGGLTGGGGSSEGGHSCTLCNSGGGGGGGGGLPNGAGGDGGQFGSSGGGGGGGGAFYATYGSSQIQSFDSFEYRAIQALDANDPLYMVDTGGFPINSRNGFLTVTPIYSDFAPPVITPVISPAQPNGDNGWYRTNVSVSWQIYSDLAITNQVGCQTANVNADTAGFNSSCSVTSAQGTTSGSITPIKRDMTAPTITATATAQGGGTYVFGTVTSVPITVTFTCSDATSGVASCPAEQTFGSNATVTGTVVDHAGNSTTVTFGDIVSNNNPPTISPIADQVTPVNTQLPFVGFTIGDTETPASQLQIRFSSSNINVVDSSGLVLINDPNNPANRGVEINPMVNTVGTTIVTVDVFDASSARASETFLVSVQCGVMTIQQPPAVAYGSFLNAQLFPTGGVAPYSMEQTNGLLPTNLEFDPAFNRLVGGPVRAIAPSTRVVNFRIVDANGCSNVVPVNVEVACLTNPVVVDLLDDFVFSLRGIVEGACPNSTITFDSNLFNQQVSVWGAINIQKPLKIQGPGADKLTIANTGPPGNFGNVISIGSLSAGEVEISGVTIKGGNAANATGGGIRSFADLTVRDSVIKNNQAERGGGIYNAAPNKTLTLINTTVSGNFAQSPPFAISAGGVLSTGPVNIVNSTISGNTSGSAPEGAAGLSAPSGTITNSTITSNVVLNNSGLLTMASGIHGITNGLVVRSSIVAGNDNSGPFPDVVGQFTSGGFNLIGNRGSVIAFVLPSDQAGSNNLAILDPQLGPLGNNGGAVPTHAILSAFSPALDRGFAFGLTSDQRGAARTSELVNIPNAPGGDGTDVGSFELSAPTAAAVAISGRVMTSAGIAIGRARVRITLPDGTTQEALTNAFGYYRFEGLAAGNAYTLEASGRGLSIVPVVVIVEDNLFNVDLIALE